MIDRKKLQKNALPIQDPDIINCINQITSEVEVSSILRTSYVSLCGKCRHD